MIATQKLGQAMIARPINKLLIANRGEIACRIIKTAKKMGIHCIAVYSEIDQQAKHVALANEAYCIGQATAQSSYLVIDKIIAVAKQSQADAIHPGYGFLSENAEFAKACQKNNIIFVGPPIEAIEAMASKSQAKEIMTKANIPLVAGYHGDQQEAIFLKQQAQQIGFPLLIKATAGGGGKGMRIVESIDNFDELLTACQRESLSSFNDDRVLLERYINQPRHIEIQIFADNHGNIVHCFERDCSLQRRHQKVLEEAPAPNFREDLFQEMAQVAINAAATIGYRGAGTVEFLLDSTQQFFFMEMNTRLQVEHPITEMITGLDLVEWQLLMAMGKPLPLNQSEIHKVGHSFEARIYAEDPSNEFLPSSGLIHLIKMPSDHPQIRIDSGVRTYDQVSVYYDPMIAKLIVWDKSRAGALLLLKKALSQIQLSGPSSNIDFLYQLANHDTIKNAEYDTHFIEDNLEELCVDSEFIEAEIIMAAAFVYLQTKTQQSNRLSNGKDPFSPWRNNQAWRLNQTAHYPLKLAYKNQIFDLMVYFEEQGYIFEIQDQEVAVFGELNEQRITLQVKQHKIQLDFFHRGNLLTFFKGTASWQIEVVQNESKIEALSQTTNIKAPMPGTVIEINVNPGDKVSAGESLMVVEAMKMEHQIKAHHDLQITQLCVEVGDLVDETSQLIEFEEY